MNLSLVIPVYNEEANLPAWTRPFTSPSESWQNVGVLLDNRFFLPIAYPALEYRRLYAILPLRIGLCLVLREGLALSV